MAINHQIKPRYETRNHEIVANLREAAGAGPPRDSRMVVKKQIASDFGFLAICAGSEHLADHSDSLLLVFRTGFCKNGAEIMHGIIGARIAR